MGFCCGGQVIRPSGFLGRAAIELLAPISSLPSQVCLTAHTATGGNPGPFAIPNPGSFPLGPPGNGRPLGPPTWKQGVAGRGEQPRARNYRSPSTSARAARAHGSSAPQRSLKDPEVPWLHYPRLTEPDRSLGRSRGATHPPARSIGIPISPTNPRPGLAGFLATGTSRSLPNATIGSSPPSRPAPCKDRPDQGTQSGRRSKDRVPRSGSDRLDARKAARPSLNETDGFVPAFIPPHTPKILHNIMNLSSRPLTRTEADALSFGLKFIPVPTPKETDTTASLKEAASDYSRRVGLTWSRRPVGRLYGAKNRGQWSREAPGPCNKSN